MELMLRNGDYVSDGAGALRRAQGREALLQRVLFRLTARRGMFPFLPDLGSDLWRLGRSAPAARQAAAEQYVAQALAAEDVTVDAVTLTDLGDGHMAVRAEMTWDGETLSVTLEVR